MAGLFENGKKFGEFLSVCVTITLLLLFSYKLG
jgi:hypothetical protein